MKRVSTGRGRRAGDNVRRCRGFTLFEILIVVAIVAVIAGMTWPSLLSYMSRQQLQDAVIQVRNEVAGTRLKAIENSLVYQFRYEPDGRWFAVLPYDRPETGNAKQITTGNSLQAAPKVGPPTMLGRLPESLQFVAPAGQRTESLPQEWKAMLPQADGVGLATWSPPLVFEMDGSSQSGQFGIRDSRGHVQDLIIRGLTGAVSLGPVQKTSVP